MDGKQILGLVTQADLDSERQIVEILRSARPADHIVSEESSTGVVPENGRTWVIDPLDGTHNFAHGIPHFAVSIALRVDTSIVGGVVHNPVSGDWFIGWQGRGAWHNGTRVRTSATRQLDQAMLATGFYYDRGEMMAATLRSIHDLFTKQIRGIRRFGAATLDICWVGIGRFDGFFEYRLAPWDFAAASRFLEEAGGKISDCQGQGLPLSHSSVLASNGPLHAPLLAIVRQHWPF